MPPAAVPLPLLADVSSETLLGCGVPAEWVDAVRQATDDTILDLAGHLPNEAAEALLDLATGGTLPSSLYGENPRCWCFGALSES